MEIGLFLNTQFPEGDNLAPRIAEMAMQVRTARDVGFASVLFPHHYLTAPLQMFQITPLMAYLLREAEGMIVAPGILILPLLNPVHVAEEAATFDLLSNGRFVLGVGLGYREPEFTALGIKLSERASRFSESIGLMRRLWAEKRVTHQGRHFSVADAGLSVRPARGAIPIWVAAQADPAIRRAARLGDAWLIVPSTTVAEVAEQMRVYRAALAEAGRTVKDFPIERECYVGSSHRTALEECRGPLEYKYAAYASWGLPGAAHLPFEEFVKDRFIIGDASFVKEEIARYQETLGVNHLIMRVQWPGLPQEKAMESIRRLGRLRS